jgi:hypothetical protein
LCRALVRLATRALTTALQATLISVKINGEDDDMQPAFDLILDDINANPGRAQHSVVLIAKGTTDSWTYQRAMNDDWKKSDWLSGIKKLQDLGVPFICAAGNYGEDPMRPSIDTIPAVFQDDDTPIIVVGAADYEGARVPSSQLGPQLTVYAPGKEVLGQRREFKGEGTFTGTSMGKRTPLLQGIESCDLELY